MRATPNNVYTTLPLRAHIIGYTQFLLLKYISYIYEEKQGTGFNNLTPNLECSNYSNGNAPTGCVATATAQVMKYFQYPLNYNWNNMPNNWGTNSTFLLMANIGSSVGMGYNCDGSGAKTSNVPNALKSTFGYSTANFGNYDYNVVLSEIGQNKPVILSSGGKKYWLGIIPYYADGHAWVADSYMRGFECFYDHYGNVNGGYGYVLFHLNW